MDHSMPTPGCAGLHVLVLCHHSGHLVVRRISLSSPVYRSRVGSAVASIRLPSGGNSFGDIVGFLRCMS